MVGLSAVQLGGFGPEAFLFGGRGLEGEVSGLQGGRKAGLRWVEGELLEGRLRCR